jgi:hypothetical protein
MRSILILCCLLFILPLSVVKAQEAGNYDRIDEFVKTFPFQPTTAGDIKTFSRELKRQFQKPADLVRAAFFWIATNITYDCDGYRNKNGLYLVEDVLRQRKGVCAGYAALLQLFCDELGIPCVTIEGFATGIGVLSLEPDSLDTNHAWNAVSIDGQWKLIDATWASGSANEDCTKVFKTGVNERYFFSDPQQFIVTHLPDSSCWQLLPAPFTRHRFSDSLKTWAKARKDFDPYVPKDSIIRSTVGGKVRFLFTEKDTLNRVSIEVYKTPEEVDYITDTVSGKPGAYYFDYKVKRPGYYRVDISLFFEPGEDFVTAVGTTVQTYFLQVTGTRKGTIATKPKTPR